MEIIIPKKAALYKVQSYPQMAATPATGITRYSQVLINLLIVSLDIEVSFILDISSSISLHKRPYKNSLLPSYIRHKEKGLF